MSRKLPALGSDKEARMASFRLSSYFSTSIGLVPDHLRLTAGTLALRTLGTKGTLMVGSPLLVKTTIYGHHEVMKQVRIAELKAHLSEYLRAVRGGQTIAVLDRETPVARIVPIAEQTTLLIRKPARGAPAPNRIALPKPLKIKLDVVDLLLEERQGHR